MRLFSKRRARLFAFLCVFQLIPTTPGKAAGLVLMNSEMLALIQIIGSQNLCITYSYDHNGNIVTRNNLAYGAQGTWGSSVYGCFNWTS